MGTTLRQYVRKWLGIDENERKMWASLEMAQREIVRLGLCVANLESELAAQKDHQNQLTSEAIKPKIVPKRQNWRQFRSSVERATEEEA